MASEHPLSGLLFGLLLLLIFWLPLPFGGNTDWAVALVGVSSSALLLLWGLLAVFGAARVPESLWDNRWLHLVWMAWLAWVAFQLMPLSQHTHRDLGSLGLNPVASVGSSISISPEITYRHLLESVSYFTLYLLVLLTVNSRERLRLLGTTIVLAGLVQAVYGSFMVLSGMEHGFFQAKTAYLGNATGTFINRNHLAGYLEICGAVCIGMVAADLKPGPAGDWRSRFRDLIELAFSRKFRMRVFLAAMVIALVLTRSRMGNVAFFTSLMVCGPLYVLLRERKNFAKGLLFFASFLIVDLLIVSQWFGLEEVVQRVEETQVETEARTYIFPELAKAVGAYWTTGTGLGTFALAILPFREAFPNDFYDHAHNDYAQFIIEVGIVGSLLVAILAVASFVHAVRVISNRRDRLRTGMALACMLSLLAMAIHSFVDFNLQIPANAATLVVVMAMSNGCSHRRKSGDSAATTGETGEVAPHAD